jgi:hypothetical protein
MQNGWNNAKVGLATGGVSGVVSGLQRARAENVNWLTGKTVYPANNGFQGKTDALTLKPGDVVDRYGGISPKSEFVSPEGVPIEQRSLPATTDLKLYNKFKVIKPFTVQPGIAAAWFGQPGGGIQYVTPHPINTLISKGYLIPF